MTEQVLAVQRMQDYIEKNKTEKISLSDLAQVSLFSPWYSYVQGVEVETDYMGMIRRGSIPFIWRRRNI